MTARLALIAALALTACQQPPDRRPADDRRCAPWQTAECRGDQ